MPLRAHLRVSPYERVLEYLKNSGLPGGLLKHIPNKWELLGDIAVIRLDEDLLSFEKLVGEAFSEVLGARAVYLDESGIRGEFRQPTLRGLVGQASLTRHVENGIEYIFDVTEIMFSSGNIDERIRFAGIDAEGETVVDMFAGIGYFTLPIAKYGSPRRVYAVEKNPVAYKYLKKNISANDVGNIVTPVPGDNREVGATGVADRVVMGYLPTPRSFLERAGEMLSDGGGIVHYHHTFLFPPSDKRVSDPGRAERETDMSREMCGKQLVREDFKSYLPRYGSFDIVDYRIIKSYAPKVYHGVADVKLV